jgi:aldehyde dehydrogenase
MYIDGRFVDARDRRTLEVFNPATEEVMATVPAAGPADIDAAAKAAKRAFYGGWKTTTAQERGRILFRLAERIRARKAELAELETLNSGKPIVESEYDIDDTATCYEYYGGLATKIHGEVLPVPADAVSFAMKEPIGVAGQIIPWNYPLLMAAWKIAPALAAGCTVVLKPAEQTPLTILKLAEDFEDLGIPAGVVNIVTGDGPGAGSPLVVHPDIRKIAFTGSTAVGQKIMEYATRNIIPVTLELGGKSPNIFFKDVMDADDAFLDKALEGFAMFALNQGEVCTCPSRALIHEDIYEAFIEKAIARVEAIKQGDPLDPTTQVGAQASDQQLKKILSYLQIGKDEGAEVLTGGDQAVLKDDLAGGYYVKPTVFKGTNDMRVFQEEIFGPVLAVTTFKTLEEAIAIANDTEYGLGAGVWSRDMNTAYRAGRAIQAGRVWTNCYHQYPAHAAFGGYKKSGIGRENHRMMLDHYQQTKNLLVSYSPDKLGFF